MKKSKVKLRATQKSVIIVIGLLVLLGGFGGGAYAYVDYQNKLQEEQDFHTVQVAAETIAAFYIDEKKARLAEDINEEKLTEARKKVDAVADDKIAAELTKDLLEVKILSGARKKVQGMLDDGVLVGNANEKQITDLTELMIEVKELNHGFAEALNEDVNKIKKQVESLTSAKEKIDALFSDEAQESVDKEVTRVQFKEAKSSLKDVVNEKEQTNLQALLSLVEAELAIKEKAKNQAKLKDFSKPTYVNGVLIASKKYPLPANHAPGESKEARSAFNKLAAAAKKEGFALTAFSTYRSYEYQIGLFDRYVQQNGEKEANRYSARPGESEHQTGLAFDVGEVGQEGDWARQKFGKTAAGKWLAKNAHHSGFIIRYPEGKEGVTGYIYEPWHLRYVGVALATKIYTSSSTLEEYVGA